MAPSRNKASFFQGISKRVGSKIGRLLRRGRLKSFSLYLPHIAGRRGLEIGGPSAVFRKGNALPIYKEIGSLDNCDFSQSTVWAKHSESFFFDVDKAAGRTIFCDGSALVEVPDASYDVVLSAHNLEHFANPVKALKEWQRVLTPSGTLVVVLPDYRETFDHRRTPTTVDHMFDDFARNTGEDDLTHLSEVIEKHDLSMDIPAGSKAEFTKRCSENFVNRCLHHHVFDEENSRELLTRAGFKVLAVDLAVPYHICLLATAAESLSG